MAFVAKSTLPRLLFILWIRTGWFVSRLTFFRRRHIHKFLSLLSHLLFLLGNSFFINRVFCLLFFLNFVAIFIEVLVNAWVELTVFVATYITVVARFRLWAISTDMSFLVTVVAPL